MNWFQAIIFGIVQGLTEFLPVSSTAHVRITAGLMYGSSPDWLTAFSAIIQLGTMLAVLIYFLRDIWRILKAWFLSIIGKVPHSDPDARMGWFVIVGTIPVAVLGLALQKYIDNVFGNLWVTVAMLIIVGVVLWVADVHTARLQRQVAPQPDRARRGATEDGQPLPENGQMRTLDKMSWSHALIIGVAQAAALIPGVSRSGATTSAGLFLGYDRPAAARYSFLLSVPAVWASGLYELYKVYKENIIGTQSLPWGPTILAIVISFAVGFAVIAWLLRFISNHTFRPFVVYRIVLALAVAGLLIGGVLSAGGA